MPTTDGMMDGRTDGRTNGGGDGGISKTVTSRLLIVVRKAATSKKGFDVDITNKIVEH